MFIVRQASTAADWREATALLHDYIEWVEGWTTSTPSPSNRVADGTGPSGRPVATLYLATWHSIDIGAAGVPRPAQRKAELKRMYVTNCTWSGHR